MPDAPTDVATQPKTDSAFAGTVIIVTNARGVQRLSTTDALSDIVSAGKLSWIDIVGADAAVRCALLQKLGLPASEQSWLQRFGQVGRLFVDQHTIRAVTSLAERRDELTEVHLFGADGLILTLWSGNPETLDPDAKPLRGTGQRAGAQSPQGGGHRAPASARDAAAGSQRHR